ncbi:MAG: TonB-dependent receptor [Rhodospirillaceae bacterium]|nr:TonB-dependent receptor [Rhodospirillaceae bacterium]
MKRYGTLAAVGLLSTTALTGIAPVMAQEAAQPVIEELVVRGRFIPEPKRETSEISSFLGEVDFQRQGDSNVALSLRRVTGLSLVNGKFIYVRGLGERYSNAILNGSPLPSPEPLRRVVPLDLFPTSIMASAAAQKTFSPQYSGEFGGGLIEIKTKSTPDEEFFEVGVSGGFNTETTWRDGLLYDGGSRDWTSFDSGIRKIPGALRAAIDANRRLNSNNFTPAELQTIGRSFANSELWVLFDGTVPGDVGVDLTYGNRWDVGDGSYGVIASAGYDSDWQTKKGQKQDGRLGAGGAGGQALVLGNDFTFTSTQNDIRLHVLLGLGAELENSEYKFTSMIIRNTSKEARSEVGLNASLGDDVRRDNLEWIERTLWTNQVEGAHTLSDSFDLTWRGSYSTAERDSPYERTVQYRDFNNDGVIEYDDQQGRNLTRFSKIDDTVKSGGADVKWLVNGLEEYTIKAGYAYTDTNRDSAQRDYRLLELGGPLPEDLKTRRIDFVFAQQNINPDRLVISEVTGSAAPPAYTGALEVHGAHIGTDAELTSFLRAALGVRYEDGQQLVDTFDFYSPNPAVETTIKESYWLPAATLTWNFAENMQLRFGGSRTIGRPQFRELAPAEFIDVDTDRAFVGNPFLTNSELDNYDARWEWYFGSDQFFTLGAFYKNLKKPIEETINEAGDNLQTTFQNVPRARLYGAEAEFKYTFETPFDFAWAKTKNFFFSTNYTYSDSKIKVKPGDTVIRSNGTVLPANFVIRDGRALQGQSDHLANLQIGYEDIEVNSAATLLLNYASKRIRASAAQTLPEIIEQPPLSLDFTYSRSFDIWGGEYELGFKAENLLGDNYSATQRLGQNRVNVDRYDLGRSFSLSLKAKY